MMKKSQYTCILTKNIASFWRSQFASWFTWEGFNPRPKLSIKLKSFSADNFGALDCGRFKFFTCCFAAERFANIGVVIAERVSNSVDCTDTDWAVPVETQVVCPITDAGATSAFN